MIVVTGASGKLSSRIAHALVALVGTERFAAMTRDPSKAGDLVRRGVRVRQGDFGDPGSLPEAFEGATQLLMISSNAASSGGDPIAQHWNAIAAARASGVRRPADRLHQSYGGQRHLGVQTHAHACRDRGDACGKWHRLDGAAQRLLRIHGVAAGR
ncbi:NAD(P)H-binding protein [Sphingomonas montana]|uniref:NAD(P)H-binding protein n=1 Tax=Sphingomonas montana TaxID=1843236 RepID=UPI0019D30C9F|nr:NAD(P)H-binding protein [Sphingomonas montana]